MKQVDNRNTPVRLIQITDPHLGADSGYIQSGINTYQSLSAVIEQVKTASFSPDLMVASGDVSYNGLSASYALFDKLLNDNQLPFCWLPGNHDHFLRMAKSFAQTPFSALQKVGGWYVLMVRSSEFNRVAGHVPDHELQHLEELLTKTGDASTVVFTHHPPVNLGSRWVDAQKISNGSEFLGLLQQFPQVKALFSGHVHQESQQFSGSMPIYTSPSTCFQFQANSDDFAISSQPPGYRWIELYDNGDVETGVEFLPDYHQSVNSRCSGY